MAVQHRVSLKELRSRIAESLGKLPALRRLRHTYVLVWAEQRKSELHLLMQPFFDRRFADPADPDVFDSHRLAVLNWFTEQLTIQTARALQSTREDFIDALSPGHKRLETGAIYDRQGVVLPPAGSYPSKIRDSRLPVSDILLHATGLLSVHGDETLDDDFILPEMTSPAIQRGVMESHRPEVARQWRSVLDYTLQNHWIRGDQIADTVSAVMAILRHEVFRVIGEADRFIQELDSYAGYQLRSRLLVNADPSHEANDGILFFKDNRRGAGAWGQRLIPPYRRNCTCYVVPILKDNLAELHVSLFNISLGNRERVLLRDPYGFALWFDEQTPTIQQKIVGHERWFSAAAQGVGDVAFADLWQMNGNLMPPRRLMEESRSGRLERRGEVASLIWHISNKLSLMNDRFGRATDDIREAGYREELRRYLNDVLRGKN